MQAAAAREAEKTATTGSLRASAEQVPTSVLRSFKFKPGKMGIHYCTETGWIRPSSRQRTSARFFRILRPRHPITLHRRTAATHSASSVVRPPPLASSHHDLNDKSLCPACQRTQDSRAPPSTTALHHVTQNRQPPIANLFKFCA